MNQSWTWVRRKIFYLSTFHYNNVTGRKLYLTFAIYLFPLSCTGTSVETCSRDSSYGFGVLPPIVSARLNTRNRFSFVYGKVVVRAKLPKGNWMFPRMLIINYLTAQFLQCISCFIELFLEPQDNAYGRKPFQSGQMRIAFVSGGPDATSVLKGGVLLSDKDPARTARQCQHTRDSVKNWSDDFHEYSLSWRPGNFRENFQKKI